MNVKIRNTLLLVSLIIVLIIIIDLIFNITGIVVEKFDATSSTESSSTESSGTNNNYDPDTDDIDKSKINSVVSKFDGKMLNITFLDRNNSSNKKVCISSPIKENANISVNSDGTLSEELKMTSNSFQQFTLVKINDADTYNELLSSAGNDHLGANESSVNETKYPFFILRSVRMENRCLAYEPGNLFLMPLGNYNNQKWDVSENSNPFVNSLRTHEVDETSIGSLNRYGNGSQNELFDPNKIKINLNLTDELRNQLGLGPGNINGGNGSNQHCPTQIPKNALSSLCRGCDPDKL